MYLLYTSYWLCVGPVLCLYKHQLLPYLPSYNSYCHEAADGVEPETEFMYDLQLPLDFVPTPLDGEVSQYYLWGMDKVCCAIDE